MYEDPFPGHQGVLNEKQEARVARMRRNLFNVFTQLSNVNDTRRRSDPIHTLDIRPGLDANQSSDIRIAESPSLLLYYLFDDWYTSYALVAKEEHQYARLLEKLVSLIAHTICLLVIIIDIHTAFGHVPKTSARPDPTDASIRPSIGGPETHVPKLCTHHSAHT